MDALSAFVTVFVVVDPIGLGPVFLTLTERFNAADKRAIALEACILAFIILAGASLFGRALLTALGISIASFRIAGGLLLFALAFEMVFGRRHERKAGDTEEAPHPGAFPLAIPLLAGPGAITAALLLGEKSGSTMGHVLLLGVIAVVLLITFVSFRASPLMGRVLGRRGQVVFGRLLGVVLAAMAVQYVADGIAAFSH